ncbi:hypothetical protein Acr_00g0086230 [Actinidia rufa]|uniref:Uncharacterized protein n=1 Tax=Actinidia rufa TaxID=165716 RepID=A0A7J0DVZ7_9ERIC|nr:hypothetical protein Acr_00g0086230 [Actinidia rufa]
MVVNRRSREEFEKGKAGFVEWVRMLFSEKVLNLIGEKMKKTEHTLDQATQEIELGLMYTDLSRLRQPSLDQIYEMLATIYELSFGFSVS